MSPATVVVSDEEFDVLVTLRDGGQDAVVKVAFGPACTQFPGRRSWASDAVPEHSSGGERIVLEADATATAAIGRVALNQVGIDQPSRAWCRRLPAGESLLGMPEQTGSGIRLSLDHDAGAAGGDGSCCSG